MLLGQCDNCDNGTEFLRIGIYAELKLGLNGCVLPRPVSQNGVETEQFSLLVIDVYDLDAVGAKRQECDIRFSKDSVRFGADPMLRTCIRNNFSIC